MNAAADARLAAKREFDLQRQVEDLKFKLRDSGDAKDALNRKILDMKKDRDRGEKRLREGYEARLREKQKENYELIIRLQELEGESAKSRIITAAAETVQLTGQELEDLRREIAEQEALLKGYQAENEAATEKLRAMKDDFSEKQELMAAENGKLKQELAGLHEERQRTSAVSATWLEEKLELDKQLQAAQEKARAAELRLKKESDGFRRAKQELEAKSAGLDLNKMEEEDQVVKQVERQMAQLQREHVANTAALEKKLKWYAENQQIIGQNNELVKEQTDTIVKLKRRLASYEGVQASGFEANPKHLNQKMAKRIKELEGEVDTLRETIRTRNPNSLAAMIHAAKPGPEESKLVRELTTQVEDLKVREAQMIEEHEGRLRALRQEHEKVRAKSAQGGKGKAGRVRELEKQLDEVRAHYAKKVKDLQKKLDESSREAPPAGQSGLKKDLAHAESRKKKLENQVKAAEHDATRFQEELANRDSVIDLLEAQVRDLAADKAALAKQLEHERAQLDRVEESKDVAALERKLGGAELAMASMQRAYSEAVEKNVILQTQSTQQLMHLQEDFATKLSDAKVAAEKSKYLDEHFKPRAEAAEKAQAGLEVTVAQLQQEIQHLKSMKEWTPQARQYTALQNRIVEMEARQEARENQWKEVVEETKRVAQMQQGLMRQRWEMALDAKNSELQGFRSELDSILQTAMLLKAQQGGAAIAAM